MAGAPTGNTNATKGRRWLDAVDRALAKRSKSEGIAELDRLAEKFLDEVEASGIAGYRELADRLDGKPNQSISGPEGQPLVPASVSVNFVSDATSQLPDKT